MRYALISDIHANLPALRAVLDDIGSRADVGATYHLGDLVGYAPWPNETVALLRERGIPGIAGNYDSTVATGYKHCGCKYEDRAQEALSHVSYAWTRAHVNAETMQYLAGLPFRMDLRPFGGHVTGPIIVLIHGNQTLNTVYVTEDRSDDFLARMAAATGAVPGDVVCFGHTHKPWTRLVNGVSYVNAGSVGRPKDGDWRACYAIVDVASERSRVEFVRVEYDVDEAVAAILASDLPHEFADYLRTGGATPTTSSLTM